MGPKNPILIIKAPMLERSRVRDFEFQVLGSVVFKESVAPSTLSGMFVGLTVRLHKSLATKTSQQ